MKKSFLVLVLASALAVGVGCSKKPNDAAISSDIQNKFSQDSGLASQPITVQSEGGVVTLAGNVDTPAERDAAGRQASSVPGVKEVVNNLEVGAPKANAMRSGSSEKKSRKSRESEGSAAGGGPSNGSGSSQPMASNGSTPPPVDNTPPPPPAPKKFIIDQGTKLTVRLVDSIDSEKNKTGDSFHATLNAPLTSDGEEAVPAGVDLAGHLVEVKSAGKFAGQSSVTLQLDSLTAGGRTYNLSTDTYKKDGSSRGKNTAEKVGGGAVIGGIIGAIAGGGKGAAIGAAAGAGVGGGVQAATKSQQIKLPSETVLNFTLQAPVTVMQSSDPNADRQKLNN